MIQQERIQAAREWLERYQTAKAERDLLGERIMEAKSTRAVATYAAVSIKPGGMTSDPVGQAIQKALKAEQEYADKAVQCLAVMHAICKAIDDLDYPVQRQALELAFIHGLTNRQGAEKAGCTQRAFQMRKAAGIRAMAARLGER